FTYLNYCNYTHLIFASMNKYLYLGFLMYMLLSACGTSQKNQSTSNTELSATALKPVGRYMVDRQQNLELISSAVHFGLTFRGKECTVYASIDDAEGHNYLQYEMDGIYQKRLRINGGSMQQIILNTANNGTHSVWIYKATEAHTGAISIHKITGRDLKVIEPPVAPLIEF